MNKIKRYIARTILSSIAVVLLVVVALDAISSFVDQLDSLAADYDLLEALIFTALTIPSSLYGFLPLSCLVGCLIGLGVLANSSELTVIRAAGVSTGQIIWLVMRPILIYIAFGLLLGEYVTPITDQFSQSRKAIALGHKSALQGQRGVWNREGNEFMHFSAVLPNGKLFGITRMSFDEQGRLLKSTYTESAIYQGNFWFESDGTVTNIGEASIEQEGFFGRRWKSEISPQLLDVLVLPPEDLPMQRLHSYAAYLEKQGQDSVEYRLAFWQKALQPLAIGSLVMIAISFIFGPLRQVTMGFRIFTGVIVGIVFRTAQDLLSPSSVIYGIPPFIAVLIPIVFCALVGMFLLRKT